MDTFRDSLLKHMDANNTGVTELAKGAGVSKDVIKKLRTRANATTGAETAARIAAYYGKSVSDFISGREPSADEAFDNLLSLLSAEEREMIRLQMQGIVAGRAAPKSDE